MYSKVNKYVSSMHSTLKGTVPDNDEFNSIIDGIVMGHITFAITVKQCIDIEMVYDYCL